eukprot:363553-Chlamydomonas_euryale.AAC.3
MYGSRHRFTRRCVGQADVRKQAQVHKEVRGAGRPAGRSTCPAGSALGGTDGGAPDLVQRAGWSSRLSKPCHSMLCRAILYNDTPCHAMTSPCDALLYSSPPGKCRRWAFHAHTWTAPPVPGTCGRQVAPMCHAVARACPAQLFC